MQAGWPFCAASSKVMLSGGRCGFIAKAETPADCIATVARRHLPRIDV
jgi:hypothetical protein